MKKSLLVFAVFLVFLSMGFGDAAGQLVSIVENAFSVSPFMASFVSFSGMIMFGLLSVPMGVQQSKIGKKKMLVIGLILFLLGAILPILALSFPIVLIAVLLMGAGATILQVSGNPLMRDVSPEGRYSSNLSFAQSVKAIGALSTSLILAIVGTKLINKSWFTLNTVKGTADVSFRILFPVFAGVLLITLICVLLFVPNKYENEEKTEPTTVKKCIGALKNPFILMMFLGIFFYCGAEASMFNRIPSILMTNNPNIPPTLGNIILIIALFLGRFLGGLVLRKIDAKSFLLITVFISIIGNVLLFFPYTTILSFIFIGIGFANIFPLIFSIAIEHQPELTNEISGLMTTAIVGAAIVPVITGLAANAGPKYAFIVTLACLIYLTIVSLRLLKTRKIEN
ncbi:MAG: MFS transporter [Bacteroidales bacterium]|jgi:FHS family L-fucose permease-like MFS transporter